jgi:hypothetical protein
MNDLVRGCQLQLLNIYLENMARNSDSARAVDLTGRR